MYWTIRKTERNLKFTSMAVLAFIIFSLLGIRPINVEAESSISENVMSSELESPEFQEPLFTWSPIENELIFREYNSSASGPGGSPYNLYFFNAETQQKIEISINGSVWRPSFTDDGSIIQFWRDQVPYQYSINTNSLVDIKTNFPVVKGVFSPNGKSLFYVSEDDELLIKDIQEKSEYSLSILPGASNPNYLWPEWSPDGNSVALVISNKVYVLSILGNSLTQVIEVGDITEHEGQVSRDFHYVKWSNDSSRLFTYDGSIFLLSDSSISNDSNVRNSHSFNRRFSINETNRELILLDQNTNESFQLTNNNLLWSKLALKTNSDIQSLFTTNVTANGFDYPVGKPDAVGYNPNAAGTGSVAGCEWLQSTNGCGPLHPGVDFNGNGGYDTDKGDSVYAVANGVVISSLYDSNSWGNIILIEHVLPDGSKVWSQYAHLDARGKNVGDLVNKGDQIGTIGKGAANYWAHLHFEIRTNGTIPANFWPPSYGWTESQVRSSFTNPVDFINSHRTIGGSGIPLPSGTTKCADEGGYCSFNGTAAVYYGANNNYYYKENITNGINCNNATFGDPISGVTKACYYKITTPPSSCPIVSGEVRLYDLTNCGGDATSANATGLWSMVSSFNDRAESIAIPSGWSARLYLNDNENSNESACFGSTDANLNDNRFANEVTVGNQATWMRVYNNSSCTGTVPAPSPPSLSSPGNGSNNPYNYDLNFQWNSSSGASEYLVEWWGGPYSTMQPCGWSSSTSCHVGTVAAGNTYSWHVRARNSSGESGWSNTWTFTIQAPATVPPTLSSPGNGAAFNRMDNINLTWNASNGATAYYAEFWGGPNLNLNSGWTSNTSWSLGSQWGGSYQWRVKARNAGGESGWSETRSLTIKYGSPSGLSASPASSTQINLSWSASADAPGNIDGYRIYRNGSAVGTVSASTTTYSDTGRTCNTTYSYVVRTYKGSSESDSSNAVSAKAECDNYSDWKGEYWNNLTLTGTPALTRNDASLNFDWGGDSPASSVQADFFSARWTRNLSFIAGTYRFHVRADDGVRLWVDGTLVINEWIDQAPTEYWVDRTMTAGSHAIKLEYYEHGGGAVAQFWLGQPVSYSDWKGEYWNNLTLTGSPVLTRNDTSLNFDWGGGSPASSIPADYFSARWTRDQSFTAGIHRFHVKADDGVRLWVDGTLVIDKWIDQAPTEYWVDRTMTAGSHAIKLEYYEYAGGAVAQFWVE